MKELYLPTGNEYVSLPDISERTAAVGSFSCLHMGAKGLVEFRGGSEPLIAPFASGAELTDFAWRRLGIGCPSSPPARESSSCAARSSRRWASADLSSDWFSKTPRTRRRRPNMGFAASGAGRASA